MPIYSTHRRQRYLIQPPDRPRRDDDTLLLLAFALANCIAAIVYCSLHC